MTVIVPFHSIIGLIFTLFAQKLPFKPEYAHVSIGNFGRIAKVNDYLTQLLCTWAYINLLLKCLYFNEIIGKWLNQYWTLAVHHHNRASITYLLHSLGLHSKSLEVVDISLWVEFVQSWIVCLLLFSVGLLIEIFWDKLSGFVALLLLKHWLEDVFLIPIARAYVKTFLSLEVINSHHGLWATNLTFV